MCALRTRTAAIVGQGGRERAGVSDDSGSSGARARRVSARTPAPRAQRRRWPAGVQQGQPPRQGYNAQAAVTTGQIIVGAEVTATAPDFGQLEPVLDAALRDLRQAGVQERPVTVLADAGYWHKEQIERIVAGGIQVLVPPDSEGVRLSVCEARFYN